MAKKSQLTDLFAKTDTGLDSGNIKPIACGLREGETAALDAIAAELAEHTKSDIARNSVMRIAVRRFLESYLAGELTLDELGGYFKTPEKPKPRLRF